MSLFLTLLIGIAVGGLAGRLLLDDADRLLMNILAGIVGSITGLAFSFFLLSDSTINSLFSWSSVLCSTVGAASAVLFFNLIHKLLYKGSKHINGTDDEPAQE